MNEPTNMLPEDGGQDQPRSDAELFNVAPSLAEPNGRDHLVRNAEVSGDVAHSARVGSDHSHDVIGQYGVWVAFANLASALFIHVIQVLGLRAKLQMFWIDASRVVALVHDNKSVWDFAPHVKFVCESMGKLRPVLNRERAVPLLVESRLPLDTAVAFVQKALGSKPFFGCSAITLLKPDVWVAVFLKAQVVFGAIAKRFDWHGAANGASAHVQPPSVEVRVMKVLGSLHGNRFSAAKPSQAGAF